MSLRRFTVVAPVLAMTLAIVISFTAMGFWVYNVGKQAEKIAQVEQLGTRAARNALFRNCQRDNFRAAEIHNVEGRAFGEARLRSLQIILPVINCYPNLQGNQPILFSPADQERFVREYRRGCFNPITGYRNKVCKLGEQ